MKDSSEHEKQGLKSNFRTTYCDGIALLLNLNEKIKVQKHGDTKYDLLHIVITCDLPQIDNVDY